MTRLLSLITLLAFLVPAVVPAVAWGDPPRDLQEEIARTQRTYNETLTEYNKAVTLMTAYRGEVEISETAVGLRQEDMDAALDKLRKVQAFSVERSDISDAEEKAAYEAAKTAYEAARLALNEKKKQFATAEGKAVSTLASLKGYAAEVANLKRQLANAQFRTLQEALSREKTVTARGEFGCEEVTVRACREGALELAKRSAIERRSAVLLDSVTVVEDLQLTKERITSYVKGVLVSYEVLDKGWVGETSYFYQIEAVVKGQLSKDFFQLAGVKDILIPPDPDQIANQAVSDTASPDAPVMFLVDDPAREVLRVRGRIGKERMRIEAERARELEQVDKTYRDNLAAIAPKDMFESEAEYQTRDAREKNNAESERKKSTDDVNREYDTLLKEEVGPLVQQARQLLSRPDIISKDAIEFHLEKYDPEHRFFSGSLNIKSDLIEAEARFHLPMRKKEARVFWENRQSLNGRVRLAMDVHLLDIVIEEFWLEDSKSGARTKERIAVIRISMPPEEHLATAKAFKAAAAALAEQAGGARVGRRYGDAKKVNGWIAEYNRLIQEAKSVFTTDSHIQALQDLKYLGSESQAAGAVTTAARGLEAYLTSFAPSEAFKAAAAALAEQAGQGARDSRTPGGYYSDTKKVNGWIAEYNRLIQEAKSVFTTDSHIQALQDLKYLGSESQAAGAVTTAARGLEAYLTSFAPSEAFKAAAAALAEQAGQGARVGRRYGDTKKVNGWIAEYNRLIQEAKSVFTTDSHIQALQDLKYLGSESQAAGAVTTNAKKLERLMTNIRNKAEAG